ncbi:hypothetical protein FPV67DRAFT_1456110 [Lyophyllum atratum]|nr:hypothetical protein FPV67DRAFT_1456110 [Lyophyllum atratum]
MSSILANTAALTRRRQCRKELIDETGDKDSEASRPMVARHGRVFVVKIKDSGYRLGRGCEPRRRPSASKRYVDPHLGEVRGNCWYEGVWCRERRCKADLGDRENDSGNDEGKLHVDETGVSGLRKIASSAAEHDRSELVARGMIHYDADHSSATILGGAESFHKRISTSVWRLKYQWFLIIFRSGDIPEARPLAPAGRRSPSGNADKLMHKSARVPCMENGRT